MSKNKINYDQALQRIETIVAELEQGDKSLDAMLKEIKEATTLIKGCKTELKSAQKEIDQTFDDIE